MNTHQIVKDLPCLHTESDARKLITEYKQQYFTLSLKHTIQNVARRDISVFKQQQNIRNSFIHKQEHFYKLKKKVTCQQT